MFFKSLEIFLRFEVWKCSKVRVKNNCAFWTQTLRALLVIWDWVGSLSLGQCGRCCKRRPFRPAWNGRRPPDTGGHVLLLQRNCKSVVAWLEVEEFIGYRSPWRSEFLYYLRQYYAWLLKFVTFWKFTHQTSTCHQWLQQISLKNCTISNHLYIN